MVEPQYITGKAEAFQLHREHIGIEGEWRAFIFEVWQRCRLDWAYKVPSHDKDRETLRLLCKRMLDFENSYLSFYRSLMLDELNAHEIDWPYGNSDYTTYCLSRFGTVVYPHDETVLAALQPYLTSNNEEWQREALAAKDKIQKAKGRI